MQCDLDSATIHYEEHGQGRPILFLHGWTMDRRLEIADRVPQMDRFLWAMLLAFSLYVLFTVVLLRRKAAQPEAQEAPR